MFAVVDWLSYVLSAEFAGKLFLAACAIGTLIKIGYMMFDELLDLRDKFRRRLRQ